MGLSCRVVEDLEEVEQRGWYSVVPVVMLVRFQWATIIRFVLNYVFLGASDLWW
jgi:hypothetical protein